VGDGCGVGRSVPGMTAREGGYVARVGRDDHDRPDAPGGSMHSSTTTIDPVEVDRRRTAAQVAAVAVGVVFLLVGVAGFIPGVTTDFDDIEFAGHESDAELFGVFQVSVLHNVVHLLFGVGGLLLAKRHDWSVGYLVGGGAVYLVLFVYGLIVAEESEANVVPVNNADDWLHLGLGVGMVVLGVALARPVIDRRGRTTHG
jgi:hypothetical protein